MPKKTRAYHSWRLEKLADPEIAEGYLNDALADSPEMFLKALLNVTQARQVAVVAKKAGVKRESIYRAFSKGGNPTLDTLNSVLSALGLELWKVRAQGASVSVPNADVPQSPSLGFKTQRKTGSRGRTFLEAMGQLPLPLLGELGNVQDVSTPNVGYLTSEMPRIKTLGHFDWQSGFGSPQCYLRSHVNQEHSEVALPDFASMASAGAPSSSSSLHP